MIHAYDKTYLSNAQKNLARMLDYLTNSLHVSLENAWHWFLTSKISMRFECGDCSVLSGMSGVELAFAVLQEAGEPFRFPHRSIHLTVHRSTGPDGLLLITNGIPDFGFLK